jgi:hypothetical protein
MSQAQVAKALGLTVRQVQVAEASGLRKMRAGLAALGWTAKQIDAALRPAERRPAEPTNSSGRVTNDCGL